MTGDDTQNAGAPPSAPRDGGREDDAPDGAGRHGAGAEAPQTVEAVEALLRSAYQALEAEPTPETLQWLLERLPDTPDGGEPER